MSFSQARPVQAGSTKAKAVEDARQMQAVTIDAARKAGRTPPKYVLMELIGRGSYGRVYKGKDVITTDIVAVKIIDIDEMDTANPRIADSYSEFLKEIGALKILSENKARNINHVIDAFPVNQTMWMITEYCGGGSVSTLMKPTSPGGIQEKWIVPILREVVEAIKWVHDAGIIHRDIKCANVLVSELGGVQLCDFGIAGILDTQQDKRSTFIGTLHWMAPELFDSNLSYGREVDIWAFGCMAYEIATGYPPNVDTAIPFSRAGSRSEVPVPRLKGSNYSEDLKGMITYCLKELPSSRPTIDQVQKHAYIWNSNSRYPTSSLTYLVRAFKMWEDHVGSRESLFLPHGAQGMARSPSFSIASEEWNFSTTATFDQEVSTKSTAQDVYDAYSATIELRQPVSEETSHTTIQKSSRRRPPPEALKPLPAPLEKIFDPVTLSNYKDNSRNQYGRLSAPYTSDLPLRDDTSLTSIKDTMIDLGAHDFITGHSDFPEMDTTKANSRLDSQKSSEDEYNPTLHDCSHPALRDPADLNNNRRTQDWTFPTMEPPISADPEISRFPSHDLPRRISTGGFGGHPDLTKESIGTASKGSSLHTTQTSVDRLSTRESLFDLDMCIPDVIASPTRPSTANSDSGSTNSDQITSDHPFELMKHASLYAPQLPPDTFSSASAMLTDTAIQRYSFSHMPKLPSPPSQRALKGQATQSELKEELNQMLGAMTLQLEAFRDLYTQKDMLYRRTRQIREAGLYSLCPART